MPNPPQFPLCQVILCVELPWGQGLLGHSTSEAPCSSKPSPSKSPVALPGMLLRLLLQLWGSCRPSHCPPQEGPSTARGTLPQRGGGVQSAPFSQPTLFPIDWPSTRASGVLKEFLSPQGGPCGIFFAPKVLDLRLRIYSDSMTNHKRERWPKKLVTFLVRSAAGEKGGFLDPRPPTHNVKKMGVSAFRLSDPLPAEAHP